MMKKTKEVSPDQGRRGLGSFLKKVGFHPAVFVFPAALGLLTSLFEGASISLLIPTLKGMLEQNFHFVRDVYLLGGVIQKFPGIFENSNSAIFIFLVLLVFITAVLKNVCQYFSMTRTLYQVRRFSNRLRKHIYDRYLSFGKAYFDQNSAGHLHQILIGYTNQISLQLRTLETGFQAFATLVVYISLMFYISWKLTLVAVVIFPVSHRLIRWVIVKIHKTSDVYTAAYSQMGKEISNALSCIPLMKAYSSEKREKQWFERVSDQVERLEYSMDKKQVFVWPLQEVLFLCMMLLLVGFVAFLVMREKAGEIAGYMVYFVMLRRVMTYVNQVNNMITSIAMVRGPIREISRVFDDEGKYFVSDGPRLFHGIEQKIEVKDVDFSYLNSNPVLRKINCVFEKGKLTAIVGSSGAGKTTLIHLLMRFYDVSAGAIFYDGMNVREFSLTSLHSKIALVSQETYLINASIKENLVYGVETVSDEDLNEALRRSRLYDFIKGLPQGLDTQVGDRGIKLSGGEKQRVSIARAILKKPEIIILDEATSSLDSITEHLIQEALNELVRGKTSIVIAHRLSTIQHADKIIVLKNGQAAEEGKLEDLIKRKGEFAQLWNAQKFF